MFRQLFSLDDLLQKDDNKIMIQDLKDKGDIMDATALAAHLIGPETGMVCPLVPEPTAEDEILRENSNSTTENLSSQSNLLTIEVNNFFQHLKYTLTVKRLLINARHIKSNPVHLMIIKDDLLEQ